MAIAEVRPCQDRGECYSTLKGTMLYEFYMRLIAGSHSSDAEWHDAISRVEIAMMQAIQFLVVEGDNDSVINHIIGERSAHDEHTWRYREVAFGSCQQVQVPTIPACCKGFQHLR